METVHDLFSKSEIETNPEIAAHLSAELPAIEDRRKEGDRRALVRFWRQDRRALAVGAGVALALMLGNVAGHCGPAERRLLDAETRALNNSTYDMMQLNVRPDRPTFNPRREPDPNWLAYCKPVETIDSLGVTRYKYAHQSDCEKGIVR